MDVAVILVLAFLGEAIWETLKMVWQEGKFSRDKVGAIVVGLVISIGTGADIFAVVGIPFKTPIIGVVLTGLLISRGANFLHDLVGSVNTIYLDNKKSKVDDETKKEITITKENK